MRCYANNSVYLVHQVKASVQLPAWVVSRLAPTANPDGDSIYLLDSAGSICAVACDGDWICLLEGGDTAFVVKEAALANLFSIAVPDAELVKLKDDAIRYKTALEGIVKLQGYVRTVYWSAAAFDRAVHLAEEALGDD